MNLEILQKWLKFNNMRFVKIINHKKFTLITILLFSYVFINLLEGERGLISYYKTQNLKNDLIIEKKSLIIKTRSVEKKNRLLTENLDLDYLEILYRKKFMVGKDNEKIYME